ncbi:hypothetical protein CR513_14597, partial [Mucuna pruriens]
MEAKVAALEHEMASIKPVLVAMQRKAEENQEKLMAMLSKQLEICYTERLGLKRLHGEDRTPHVQWRHPVGWIARVEIYFQVQETSLEVRVSLAQLCMEGSTIHFKSLLEEGLEMGTAKM